MKRGCPECRPENAEEWKTYGFLPENTPDSFNDLEHGSEYRFCDVCFTEWVSREWYDEHYGDESR